MTLTIDEEVSIGRLIEEKIRQHYDNHLNHWHTKYFGRSIGEEHPASFKVDGLTIHQWVDKAKENEEKAKRMDYLEKCHPMITATEIDDLKAIKEKWDQQFKPGTIVVREEWVDELQKKAKKYDELHDGGKYTTIETSQFNAALEWIEKAKKLDELTNELVKHDLPVNDVNRWFQVDVWKEWKEKAKRFDYAEGQGFSFEKFQELKEKAKNCDTEKSLKEFFQEKSERLEEKLVELQKFQHHILGGESVEKAHEIRERAEKWAKVIDLISEDEYFGLKEAKE